jgi:hypothetical protein
MSHIQPFGQSRISWSEADIKKPDGSQTVTVDPFVAHFAIDVITSRQFSSSPFPVSDLVLAIFELLVPAKNKCSDGRIIVFC